MDTVSVSSRARARADFRVRRRRYNSATMLVFHNDWFEIDRVTDTVWLACEEGLTVADIVRRVAGRHQLPLADSVAAVSFALGHFHSLGFVELSE